MAKTRIDLDSKTMRAVLLSGGVLSEVMAKAEQIASRARAGASCATGEYRDSIVVEPGVGRDGDRAAARVVAKAPHARIVEAKTGNLKRAIRG